MAIPTGIDAVRHRDAGRRRGMIGLGLAVLTVVSFVALINSVDY